VPPAEDDDRSLNEVLTAVAEGDDRFCAVAPDWFGPQAFGGVVVAHAVNAALQTVDDPATLHSLHGYFLRPVTVEEPVEVRVERTRDGRAFSARQVVTERGKPVFSMMCSFHAPEAGDEYQLTMPDVPPPEDLDPVEFEADGPVPYEMREALEPVPRADGSYESTRRCWFRVTDPWPAYPAAHLTAAAFFSDMTGTSFRPHNLGEWGTHTDASLDHAVWFHRPIAIDEWLLFDLYPVINHGGRSTIRGSMFSRDGLLRLSMAQELLIRPLPPENT
jgi:acyl-CoA thioesterase-2